MPIKVEISKHRGAQHLQFNVEMDAVPRVGEWINFSGQNRLVLEKVERVVWFPLASEMERTTYGQVIVYLADGPTTEDGDIL